MGACARGTVGDGEGDPSETTQTTQAATSASGDASIFTRMGIDDPKAPEFDFDTVAKPYDDAAGCKAFSTNIKPQHDCSCDSCFDIQQQCDALPGCIEIAECGTSIGCSDAYTCYLTPTDTKCVPIIDKWGNTGVSAALSLALATCRTNNSCN